MQHFDAIVIGTGAVGSAAVFELARRGAKVLGVDRYDPPHDRGSSHGATRMIRQAYFEHVDYVPLLRRAYELWNDLEERVGRTLFEQVGLVEVGPSDGVVVPGVLAAAHMHSLRVETLGSEEFVNRFPMLRLPDRFQAVFEPTAGYLHVEACIAAYLELARRAGAELRTHTEAKWKPDGGGVVADLNGEMITADRCIVTQGAWAGELLRDLGIQLTVRRKPLYWYHCATDVYAQSRGMPCFFFELPEGQFYGFPAVNEMGLKVARHDGGRIVSDPAKVDCSLDLVDQTAIERFLTSHLPGVSQHCLDMQVCMYTMSPDEHFIVDRHPEFPQVVLATGLSGHGFKFACVLAETLADLALDAHTSLPVEFLSIRRFLA
ncbi:MAG: N-methyl-L-tryptophan oxidase [Planctomycetales bacterium]|nr:N-methyl-L-tryptophan oxidase [Planctomycetales bacterium]